MGWGQEHHAAPSPVATTGTTNEIGAALEELEAVGITDKNLARAAAEAAREVARLRHRLDRHVRQGDTAHGARA